MWYWSIKKKNKPDQGSFNLLEEHPCWLDFLLLSAQALGSGVSVCRLLAGRAIQEEGSHEKL